MIVQEISPKNRASLRADKVMCPQDSTPISLPFAVRLWQILLQKSFCTGDQKFSGLWARLSCKDVGDLIA
jgi:hypothetical protein